MSAPYPPDMDPECIPLCDALNALPGLTTVESCCGHVRTPFRIFMRAEALDAMRPLLLTLDCGWPWSVRVRWNCAMSFPVFCLEGRVGAFEGAHELAAALRERGRVTQ